MSAKQLVFWVSLALLGGAACEFEDGSDWGADGGVGDAVVARAPLRTARPLPSAAPPADAPRPDLVDYFLHILI